MPHQEAKDKNHVNHGPFKHFLIYFRYPLMLFPPDISAAAGLLSARRVRNQPAVQNQTKPNSAICPGHEVML
jgi:hypothetical protein